MYAGLARGLEDVVGPELELDLFSNSDLKDDTGFCQICIQQSTLRYVLALLTMGASSVPSSVGSSMARVYVTASVLSLTSMQRQDELLGCQQSSSSSLSDTAYGDKCKYAGQ